MTTQDLKPAVTLPGAEKEADAWRYPDYQVVCISRTRLGDCGEFYYVKDSVASKIDGQNYCWLLLTHDRPAPKGGLPSGSPGYEIVCWSYTRLGDCGTYWRVKDSVEGTMTDGLRALWLLVE